MQRAASNSTHPEVHAVDRVRVFAITTMEEAFPVIQRVYG